MSDTSTWEYVNNGKDTYYSGLDAAIWFGTGPDAVFLGNTVSLEYSIQEMVMPLMAYSDFTKRRTARGQRIVHGNIVMMYQQTLLMYQLLEHLSGNLNSTGVSSPLDSLPGRYDPIPQLGAIIDGSSSLPAIEGTLRPEQARSLIATLSSQVQSKAGLDTFNLRKQQYEKLAADAKKKSPQKAITESVESGVLFQMQTRLSSLYTRYDTVPEGFTITIDFKKNPKGPTALEPETIGIAVPLSYAEATAQMEKGYQSAADKTTTLERSLVHAPAYTTRKLIGVEISGMQQIIDDSGRPLMESYSFIASDLI